MVVAESSILLPLPILASLNALAWLELHGRGLCGVWLFWNFEVLRLNRLACCRRLACFCGLARCLRLACSYWFTNLGGLARCRWFPCGRWLAYCLSARLRNLSGGRPLFLSLFFLWWWSLRRGNKRERKTAN